MADRTVYNEQERKDKFWSKSDETFIIFTQVVFQ